MSYIPEPIERMESQIDDLAFEQFAGVDEGSVRCYDCRQIVPLDEAVMGSARPDAPMICIDCAEKC